VRIGLDEGFSGIASERAEREIVGPGTEVIIETSGDKEEATLGRQFVIGVNPLFTESAFKTLQINSAEIASDIPCVTLLQRVI